MNISLGVVDFLMLALVVQGFVLALLLTYTSKKFPGNGFIAAFIFAVAESTLLMEFDYCGILQKYPWLLTALVPLSLTFGPLIYLYARSLVLGSRQPVKLVILHLLPGVLLLKHQIIYMLYITGLLSIPDISEMYVAPLTQKILFGYNNLTLIPAFCSLVIYAAATYKLVSGHEEIKELSTHKQADIRWIKRLVQLIGGLIAIWLVSIITGSVLPISQLEPWFHYCLYIPAIVFVYWLGMTVYKRQSLMNKDEIQEYAKQPVKTYFKEDEANGFYNQLKELMVSDSLYLNSGLKVDMLAARLSISEKSLSSILNQHVGKSFNDFVNEYRVEEAKRKLTDSRYGNFTIAAIAFECGFNSLATFQRVFKQTIGVTPSQYQNKNSALPQNNTQIPI